MLIPRDVWELAATVPLPKILKTSSPSTPTNLATSGDPVKPTLSTSGDPLKPAGPVPSSLLQQSSALLLKSSAQAAPSSPTTVEDWIAEAPWVEVRAQSLDSCMGGQQIIALTNYFRPFSIHLGYKRQGLVGNSFKIFMDLLILCDLLSGMITSVLCIQTLRDRNSHFVKPDEELVCSSILQKNIFQWISLPSYIHIFQIWIYLFECQLTRESTQMYESFNLNQARSVVSF